MSEHDDADLTELHPEITAQLRDEPVAVDPIRREAAVDAALELSSTLFPADTSTDELAARRQVAPVPTPRRASLGGPRRVALVAAAVLLVAGLGVAGIVASGGQDDSALSSGSAEDSASTLSGSEMPPGPTSSGAEDPTSSGGSNSAGGATGESDTTRSDQETASDQAVTTTAPQAAASTAFDAGTFASVEELLEALVDTSGYRSDALQGVGAPDAGPWNACADELGAAGLTVTGRATVGSRPVWLAVTAPDASVVVVLDAATCAELARR
ncbi:MAG: hypothetical protein M3Y51_03745 [Actinomycetota bacterium]|nr:hypothetical protein [Actinomycetota bacterium]